jgi:hypothetical protein
LRVGVLHAPKKFPVVFIPRKPWSCAERERRHPQDRHGDDLRGVYRDEPVAFEKRRSRRDDVKTGVCSLFTDVRRKR